MQLLVPHSNAVETQKKNSYRKCSNVIPWETGTGTLQLKLMVLAKGWF